MEIIDITWYPDANRLLIECGGCLIRFTHAVNMNSIKCPRCKKTEIIENIREAYIKKKPSSANLFF